MVSHARASLTRASTADPFSSATAPSCGSQAATDRLGLASERVEVHENQRGSIEPLALAALLPRSEQVLALTSVKTATQKFARSFAQELLCPWAELDAFTDEHGTGESAIARAADRYLVSEMAITTALVNRGKLDRDRLSAFAA